MPKPKCLWIRGGNVDRLVRNGVFEADVAGVQADAAVGVGARRTVFEVALNGAADSGQLAAYLMMPPRVKPHFEQGVPLGMAYEIGRAHV